MLRLPLVSLLFLLPCVFGCSLNEDEDNHESSVSLLLENLNNYIYDTNYDIFAERTEKLAPYYAMIGVNVLKEAYGKFIDDKFMEESMEKQAKKAQLAAKLLEISDQLAEIAKAKFFATHPNAEHILEFLKRSGKEIIAAIEKYASVEKMAETLKKVEEIHKPVILAFANNTEKLVKVNEIRARRDSSQLDKEFKELLQILKKLNLYAFGALDRDFFPRTSRPNFVLEPSIVKSIYLFLKENYQHILEKKIDDTDPEKEEKDQVIAGINKREDFDVNAQFVGITLCKKIPWTDVIQKKVDGINALAEKELKKYAQVRSLEELKEVEKRVQKVYGLRFE